MIDLKNLRVQAQRLKDNGARYVPIDPASVLGLLDLLEAAQKDAARLDFIQEATVDVRCVELGEDSYGWEVMEHHMAAPNLRKIGGSFNELGLRDAIDAAMASQS